MNSALLFLGEVSFLDLILILLCTAVIGIWFRALVDCLKSQFNDNSNKIIWVLVIITFPLIGGILYYAIGQKQRT
jgi:hypothetical protein